MKESKFLHDIASPLAGVSLIAESILADIPTEATAETELLRTKVQEVLNGMERMRKILDDRREEISNE